MKIDPHKGVSLRNLKAVGKTTNFQRENISHTKDLGPEELQMSQKQEVNAIMPLHF